MSLSTIPVAAVLGHPINHSKSPKLHNYWLSLFDIDGHYIPLDIDPRNFENSIRALGGLGFVGANVTIPYKEKILKISLKIYLTNRKFPSPFLIQILTFGKDVIIL